MSSRFFSSRENIRISASPAFSIRRTTAWPKVPVPPVTRSLLPANTDLLPEESKTDTSAWWKGVQPRGSYPPPVRHVDTLAAR